MPFRIAVAGKGGTGKTTLSALLLRAMLRSGRKPLLAADADPNSCLAERLGVAVGNTIGQLREDLRAQPDRIPAGLSKSEWIERLITQEVTESIGFDVIVMGRQEGPECYCYINNLLRACLEKLAGQYKAVVIDNEAGLEHLSRRTNGRVEVMLVVCEPTFIGARTAQRITDLMRSLELDIGSAYLVLNRYSGEMPPDVAQDLEKTGLPLLGGVPDDPLLLEFERERRSVLELPDDAKAVVAVNGILARLMEGRNV